MSHNSHGISTSSIKSCVREFTAKLGNHDFRYPHLRESSVLVALIIRNGDLQVLLTKRSTTLRTHPGDVCFPGGVKDSTDKNDIDTALREAEEEIGLKRENIDVIGVLPPLVASPMTSVVPVIGIIKEEFTPNLNTDEVAYIMYLPLETFSSDNCETKLWNFVGRNINIFYFRKEHNGKNDIIYGLTSLICMAVAAIVLHKTDTIPYVFVGESEQVGIEKTFRDYYYYCGQQLKYQTPDKVVETALLINPNKSRL